MMKLERPVSTPIFVVYATHYALKSTDQDWPENVSNFDPNPIKIPPYQRKIVWDKKTVTAFLESNAVLFGTVILAKPPKDEEPFILLDGLQRFATATAILNYLHSDVLTKIETDDVNLKRITAETESKKAIFEHNDHELRNNTRTGIRKSYKQLYDNVRSVIDEGIKEDPKILYEKMMQTFVKKQIAIDAYHGFKNANEYTETFININSTGINLTEVDLLRSAIIQQAENMGWDEPDIDETENRFTDVFQSEKIKATKVLGKHLYDVLKNNPARVFKNWNNLEKSNVDDLLDFIEMAYDASNEDDEEGNKKWPYLYENFQCGDIPFAIIVWFYYKKHHENGRDPDFLNGAIDTADDLRYLLRAFYRRIINSSMNRADIVASKLVRESNLDKDQSIRKIAGEINCAEQTLDVMLEKAWIRSNLRKSNTGKTRRVFNACLLPKADHTHDHFRPLNYNVRNNGWTLDYLIPKSGNVSNNDDREQIDAITNKIPLRADLKKKARDKTCMEKIKPDGLLTQMQSDHPYIVWLTNEHYETHKESHVVSEPGEYALNSLACLSNSSEPKIGNARLDKIIELLHERI